MALGWSFACFLIYITLLLQRYQLRFEISYVGFTPFLSLYIPLHFLGPRRWPLYIFASNPYLLLWKDRRSRPSAADGCGYHRYCCYRRGLWYRSGLPPQHSEVCRSNLSRHVLREGMTETPWPVTLLAPRDKAIPEPAQPTRRRAGTQCGGAEDWEPAALALRYVKYSTWHSPPAVWLQHCFFASVMFLFLDHALIDHASLFVQVPFQYEW
ncbi:hypothetical protein M011DRAFT_108800 [Sporormia fimetaria CBS 119925]|uniref:Uncharacterized protein n=1 Tax=Sporormia fimetaria CBS 119925 TaxID=1340428 RepID=A0A6A6VL10_9PLEO|nr:hypothetical protein M011DRAFT_108800 [Sporormia fimetaria CBS 119925]